MQRACEKSFDAGLASLYVPRLLGPSKQQLLDAFGKQLTTAATALQESPAMQLTAITAMRRRTAKPPKTPRGVRVGLGVVGACHSKIGGGQGNLQTFAGYTSGLNSAHVLFAKFLWMRRDPGEGWLLLLAPLNVPALALTDVNTVRVLGVLGIAFSATQFFAGRFIKVAGARIL